MDIIFPHEVVQESFKIYAHTVFGYFLGNRLPFPIVERYVSNACRKFGLTKSMMTASGFFYFKFGSDEGVKRVLEQGPWMIRNVPIILKKWSPDINVKKTDVTSIPIRIKMHDIPLVGYTYDGLSAIATKIGKPMMLDSYTSNMCVESWGRPSIARAMVEVSSLNPLKEKIVVATPTIIGNNYVRNEIRVEYEWKPPRRSIC